MSLSDLPDNSKDEINKTDKLSPGNDKVNTQVSDLIEKWEQSKSEPQFPDVWYYDDHWDVVNMF